MKRRMQTYRCAVPECSYPFEVIVELEDDVPSSMDSCPPVECPACGVEAPPVMAAPMHLKATFHDGYQRGDRWRVMKEIAQRESESLDLPEESRGELHREIARLQTDIIVRGRQDKDGKLS